jgi:mono/diheme cytochrome c family protein
MRTVIVAAALACALGACTQANPPMTEAQLVERGNYLVNNVGGCNDCHTPQTPTGPDTAHALQGGPLAIQLLPQLQGQIPWAPVAPSIAGGPAGYTDEQLAAFLQTGARPDGSHPNPPMPPFRFNEDDARAIVAYIKPVPRGDAAPAAPATTP